MQSVTMLPRVMENIDKRLREMELEKKGIGLKKMSSEVYRKN